MPDTAPASETKAPETPVEREFRARIRHARISARKVRYVTDLLRGRTVNQAKQLLAFSEKRGARFVNKLLDSVVANVSHLQQEKDLDIDLNSLRIHRIWADVGPTMKRFTAAPMGRALPIKKRFCHICVVVRSGRPSGATSSVRERRVRASRAAPAPAPKE